MLVDPARVWLFGTRSAEVWANVGDLDQPFQPIPGAEFQQGIVAPWSLRSFDNSPMWVGRNGDGHGMVWRANGYRAERISNHAVEHALQTYGRLERVLAWTYQQDGHGYYLLEIPHAPVTWVYDVAANLWHERSHWIVEEYREIPHRARFHAFEWNRRLVGDRLNGAIYELALDQYEDQLVELVYGAQEEA